jgi:hypothetical protein
MTSLTSKFLPVCDRLGVQPGQNLGVKLSLHAHLARALDRDPRWRALLRLLTAACGTKRTWPPRRSMSALGGKADMPRQPVVDRPVQTFTRLIVDRSSRACIGQAERTFQLLNASAIGHALVKVGSFVLHRSLCETCCRNTRHPRRKRLGG